MYKDITLGSFNSGPNVPVPQVGDSMRYFDEEGKEQLATVTRREFVYASPDNKGSAELTMIVFSVSSDQTGKAMTSKLSRLC